MGAMIGGLTYGAKKEESERHFKEALALIPESAIARMEYANAQVMLHGKSRLKAAEALYAEAAECEPMDAMERLDVEAAREELED
nr:putative tetratricopeptide repeat family protein [Aeromonas allosaccharophila]